MNTLYRSITNIKISYTQVVVYGLFAVTVASVMVFAVLPLIPDVHQSSDGVSLSALHVGADDGGGDGGGDGSGDGGSGDGGGDGAGGDDGSGDGGGDATDGCCGDDGNGDGGGDATDGCCGDGPGDGPSAPSDSVGGDSPTPPTPACTLTSSQARINRGGSALLTWTTRNATAVSINQGIGAVAQNGSKTVSPTATITYTLTATGPGGSVTCARAITVVIPTTPAPTCTLTASPVSIMRGRTSTLTWSTTNAVSVSIDQSIGAVAANGNKPVSPTATTTYTLIAKNSAGVAVTCATRVRIVVPPVGPIAPTCTLDAVPVTINRGSAATLSWGTTNATSVSINQGVGVVGTSGTKSVSPTATTTYTLTARNSAGATVTCTETVNVIVPQVPLAPTCTLNANPTRINRGNPAMLAWNTSNATAVSINQGIGAVSAGGGKAVSPTATTTYTLTARNSAGATVTCTTTIEVVIAQVPIPACTLASNVRTITRGGTARLTWTSTNATGVSISQGVGTVAQNGAKDVSPTATTTYVLTATGPGGSVTCTQIVNVIVPPTSTGPHCDSFSASPSSLRSGESTTLTWTSSDATQASINQGVGTVELDGSKSVTVNDNTTYTLTLTDPAGKSVTCDTAVSIATSGGGGGGGGSSMRCTLRASDTKVKAGEKVTLSWTTRKTDDIILKDNHGETILNSKKDKDVDEDKGSVTVRPMRTTTYVMTAERGSRERTCRITITVENSLTSVRSQEPVTISLTQVPYTGFDAGPFMTSVFYALLVAWALGVAYVLVIRKKPVATGPHTFAVPVTAALTAPHASVTPAAPVIENKSFGYAAEVPVPVAYEIQPTMAVEAEAFRMLEARAQDARVLMSSDALRFVMAQSANEREQRELVDVIIGAAKAQFPSEDGWIVVNKERILSLLK